MENKIVTAEDAVNFAQTISTPHQKKRFLSFIGAWRQDPMPSGTILNRLNKKAFCAVCGSYDDDEIRDAGGRLSRDGSTISLKCDYFALDIDRFIQRLEKNRAKRAREESRAQDQAA